MTLSVIIKLPLFCCIRCVEAGALKGDVEVDGAYFGGYIKPANERKDRKGRRKKIHQNGKRQVVAGVAIRERGTTVHADEVTHWDSLPYKADQSL